MLSNNANTGSCNSEWLNEINNIDGSDPDASYAGKLPYEEIREYKTKDQVLGFGDCYFFGD